jgi:hypothetical protein
MYVLLVVAWMSNTAGEPSVVKREIPSREVCESMKYALEKLQGYHIKAICIPK